jgi:site-specific DNA-methyltransferase (adenine-specific)
MLDIKDIENKIINADCMDILKELPDKCIDLVLTDPPYRDESENQPTMDMRANGMVKTFGDKPTKELFNEIFRISKKQIIFGANNFELPPYKGFLIWNKGIAFDFTMSMCELAYISETCGTIAKIFNCRASGQEYRIHPTQKPLKLFEQIINYYSNENDLILDCFSGSGTTAVACYNLKRRFICIEKDKDYFGASVERLKNVQAQMKLF